MPLAYCRSRDRRVWRFERHFPDWITDPGYSAFVCSNRGRAVMPGYWDAYQIAANFYHFLRCWRSRIEFLVVCGHCLARRDFEPTPVVIILA